MSLNTEIFGDPEGCRASGQWLRTLGEGVLDSAVLLHQISVNSEWCWNDRPCHPRRRQQLPDAR